MENKLSVIVPIYNEERWISRCLDSILRQTFSNFEVIIINDGSTDNSLDIIEKYCRMDERINCVTTENQGNAKALNVGLEHVTGDLVTFADADDYIEDRMYETMGSALIQSDADIVECGCRKINMAGRTLVKLELKSQIIEGTDACARHFMKQRDTGNYVWNKVYRKGIFEELRFPDISYSMDYYLNAIVHSKIKKKVSISDIFYNYMIHSGQATNNFRIGKNRIDGIRAGNMVAGYFSHNKELRAYACLYTCKYALEISEFVYKTKSADIKEFLREINRELLHTVPYISLKSLESRAEQEKIYQCILLMIFHERFFDFKWLFELHQ